MAAQAGITWHQSAREEPGRKSVSCGRISNLARRHGRAWRAATTTGRTTAAVPPHLSRAP